MDVCRRRRYCVEMWNYSYSICQILYMIYIWHLLHKTRSKIYKKKAFWVRTIFLQRKAQGDFHNLIKEMQVSDPAKHLNYIRMTACQFEALLQKVGAKITKVYHSREPISAAERLSMTLRYLASGDSMHSISYAFRVGVTTVSNIIRECCKAIWESLNEEVLRVPDMEKWYQITEGFEQFWQIPNCIGCIDGKHVVIQAPSNSGSIYFNYKKSHSLQLMAVCDYKYKFTLVDIGAPGRQSDGGVFRNSEIGRKFYRKELNFPPDRPIEYAGENIPFYFVGDEAFSLSNNLMRPYPGRFLPQMRRIFNYRLCRARRVIENTFGILCARWRIFRKAIIACVDSVQSMIQATICLHNYLMDTKESRSTYCPDDFIDQENQESGVVTGGHWRTEVSTTNLLPLGRSGSNNRTKTAADIRDDLTIYFMLEGAVRFQWDK